MSDRPLSERVRNWDGMWHNWLVARGFKPSSEPMSAEINEVADEIAALEQERDDLATIIAGDAETGRQMWIAYHTVEAYKADNHRLRAAIEDIGRLNETVRAALEGGKDA